MSGLDRYFPWCVVGVAALFLVMMMASPTGSGRQMAFDDFARLPVVHEGRVKPFDTLARNSLMIISGRQDVRDEKGKKQADATQWLLDVITSRFSKKGAAESYKVFRIENDQVLALLGLERRPLFYRYAINEFADKMELIEREATLAQGLNAKQQEVYHRKIIELARHLQLYVELANLQTLFLVPPATPGDEWRTLPQAFHEIRSTGQEDPAAVAMGGMLLAYIQDDPKKFDKELVEYQKYLDRRYPSQAQAASFESFYNHFAPFSWCPWLYLGVFLLACLSWVGWTVPLRRAAFWLALLLLAVHTWGLFARMYLTDRPLVFVTNLYSSAIFIGWVGVIVALLIEWKFPLGIGIVVAAVLGFCTLLLAPILGGQGDNLEMLQAVLDTNFWLATHVTCVTFGYAATLVAGVVGVIFVVLGVLTRVMDRDLYKIIGRIIYGAICFATFLSFTGTVLGGIWADQSWGRFWGWDPKENGALLIVLWNALILHARWAGLIQQRGMAVLAIAGNIVTLWSWWGTNQLGVGLHAYGFNNELTRILLAGWATHIVLVCLGLVPMRYWVSYQVMNQEPRPAGRKSRGRRGPSDGLPAPGHPDTRFKPGLGNA